MTLGGVGRRAQNEGRKPPARPDPGSLYTSWIIRQRLDRSVRLKVLFTAAVYVSTDSSSNLLLLHPVASEELLSSDEDWNAETRDSYERNFEVLANIARN